MNHQLLNELPLNPHRPTDNQLNEPPLHQSHEILPFMEGVNVLKLARLSKFLLEYESNQNDELIHQGSLGWTEPGQLYVVFYHSFLFITFVKEYDSIGEKKNQYLLGTQKI